MHLRPRLHFVVIPLAALLAVAPLLVLGPSCGHDFDFHLLSWLEAAQQIAHGGYPHWAYTPALNAGEPRFLFYPPLSWLLGALLGLVLPWKLVTTAFTWVCLTLCGFTARRLTRRYAAEGAATLAAVLYLVNPYMLFNAYERAAYGELLASAWLPLLFAAALAPELSVVELALPIALLWLTNVPAAVMGCYALALLLAVRLCLRSGVPGAVPRSRLAWKGVAGVALGLALPAYYLLPAAFERRYVQAELATGVGFRILDATLFHHMGPPIDSGTLLHDRILYQASLIAVGLLVLTALFCVALFCAARLRKQRDSTTVALAVMAGCIAFLMTPLSLWLWPHIPQLAYLQFPWRMCSLLAVAVVLLLARVLPRGLPPNLSLPQAYALASLALVLMIQPAWTHYRQPCDDEDSIPGRVAQFHSPDGTESMDEYTPVHAVDDVPAHDPAYWSYCAAGHDNPEDDDVAPPANATANVSQTQNQNQTPARFVLTVPCPSLLVLNRRQYPAWRVTVNGVPVAPHVPERQDGLITIALPAGTSTVQLTFARTPDRSAGLGISLLAGVLAVTLRRRRTSS